jgi:uncharacterized membrane protein
MVKIGFQRHPWDLVAILGYTVAFGGVVAASGSGTLVAVPIIAFTPGYCAAAAIFPGKSDISWSERIGLSIALSMALLALLGVGLHLSFGISLGSVTVGILTLSLSFAGLAYVRRMRLVSDDRLTAAISIEANWHGQPLVGKLASVALIGSLGIGCVALYYSASVSPSLGAYSQFSLVGPNGTAADAPSALAKSQPASVGIVLTNHEGTLTRYTVQVLLIGLRVQRNTTTGFNTTVITNTSAIGWLNVSLTDGQRTRWPFNFTVDFVGLWKIQFLLFKDGDLSAIYRELDLFVQVT